MCWVGGVCVGGWVKEDDGDVGEGWGEEERLGVFLQRTVFRFGNGLEVVGGGGGIGHDNLTVGGFGDGDGLGMAEGGKFHCRDNLRSHRLFGERRVMEGWADIGDVGTVMTRVEEGRMWWRVHFRV